MVQGVISGHVDVHACAAAEGYVWVCDTGARARVDVCGLCYYQRPCRCWWSVLLSEAMLMSVDWVTPEGLVDVCGLCCCCPKLC